MKCNRCNGTGVLTNLNVICRDCAGTGVDYENPQAPARSMKLYLAGPMSGLPDYNRPAFHEAARQLRAQGYEVLSPAELQGDDADPWHVWMRKALRLLLECDAIVLLPGWHRSRGVALEREVAGRLGMKLYMYRDGGELTEILYT